MIAWPNSTLRATFQSAADLHGVGFKTVLGRNLTGCVFADERVIAALEGFREIARAQPAYATGIRQFQEKLPGCLWWRYSRPPSTNGCRRLRHAYGRSPDAWHNAGRSAYGFHGASHKFIAERSAELLGREDVAQRVRSLYQAGPTPVSGPPLRVISCHLGAAVQSPASATAWPLAPAWVSARSRACRRTTAWAISIPRRCRFVLKTFGLPLAEIERQMTRESGLLGLSGASNDVRDLRAAAGEGNARAALALDVFTLSARHWIGGFHFELADVRRSFSPPASARTTRYCAPQSSAVSTRLASCSTRRRTRRCGAPRARFPRRPPASRCSSFPQTRNSSSHANAAPDRGAFLISTTSTTTSNSHNSMSEAIGLLETRGLTALVTGTDAMLKAANVTLAGPMKQVGNALVTAVVIGDVAAVKAATDAGAQAARTVGEVVSVQVIPRPHDDVQLVLPKARRREEIVNARERIRPPVLPAGMLPRLQPCTSHASSARSSPRRKTRR